MVLIRLAHAATLPTLDEALKALDENPPARRRARRVETAAPSGNGAMRGAAIGGRIRRLLRARVAPAPASRWRGRPCASSPPSRSRSASPAAARIRTGAPAVPSTSMQDLADLADRHRDPLMKVNIRKCMRLVSIEPGKLAVNLTEDAPRALLGDLSRKLHGLDRHALDRLAVARAGRPDARRDRDRAP
jgi:DNA polymerase-3 subunit gamma/tau